VLSWVKKAREAFKQEAVDSWKGFAENSMYITESFFQMVKVYINN